MAKKRAGGTPASNGAHQQEFEGDGFPEKPPKEVEDARDAFLTSMRSAAKAREKKGQAEQKLIELMHKHDIPRLRLDGENKFIEIDETEKAKIKTFPKEQRSQREKAAAAT